MAIIKCNVNNLYYKLCMEKVFKKKIIIYKSLDNNNVINKNERLFTNWQLVGMVLIIALIIGIIYKCYKNKISNKLSKDVAKHLPK